MKSQIITEVPPHCNSGESLTIETDILDDEQGIYLLQRLTLQSYGNMVTLSLSGNTLTPTFLRQLANEIEAEILKIKGIE